MDVTRRDALRLAGASLGSASLAGCAGLFADPEQEVVLLNRSDGRRLLWLELHEHGEGEESATVLDREFELPPATEADPATKRRVGTVGECGRYLVRASLPEWDRPRHRHYVPNCDHEQGRNNELYVEIRQVEAGREDEELVLVIK